MYTTTLLCLIIFASSIVVQSQYQLITVYTPPGLADSTSGTIYPGVRQGACLQYKSDSTLSLFGGLNGTSVLPNALWSYSTSSNKWSIVIAANLSRNPTGRQLMSCWINSNNQLGVFGGDIISNIYYDAYVATSSGWTSIPNGGTNTQATNWRIGGVTYNYGGLNPSITSIVRAYGDSGTWYIQSGDSSNGVKPPTYTGSGPTIPGSRIRTAYAANSTGGYFYGGVSGQSVYGDLWYYDPPAKNWTFLSGKTTVNDSTTSDGQPPCMYSAVMGITSYGNILLYGGQGTGGQQYTTLWKYSVLGRIWTRFSGSIFNSPATPLSSLIAYTSDGAGGIYMFGGADTSGVVTNSLYRLKFSECQPGFFINSSNLCSACPFGNTGATNNSDVCGTCQPGNYVKTNTTCAPCPMGTYTRVPGRYSCTPCGVGLATTANGSTVCSQCNAGFYASNGICTRCPAGTYSDTGANLACITCPPGTYSATSGSVACTNCPAGRYNNGGGNSASSCIACAPGTNRTSSTSGPCAPCPPGTYAANSGSSLCSDCPAGQFADQYGSLNCSFCGFGQASNPGTPQCRLCQPGTQLKLTPSSSCVSCLRTGFTSNYGNKYCFFCPYGSISNNINGTGCAYCPVGTYHDATNTDGCSTDTFGNRAPCCSPCPAGTYADVQGSAQCTSCAVGFFSSTKGATYCLQCPVNTHSSAVGSTSCTNCPSGSYSPGGSQWCSPTGY